MFSAARVERDHADAELDPLVSRAAWASAASRRRAGMMTQKEL